MQSLIDFFASLLRIPGDGLRNLTLAIPLSVARGIFIFYFVVLLVWVLRMRKSEVVGVLPGRKKTIDLRLYAAIALIGQIVIYLVF